MKRILITGIIAACTLMVLCGLCGFASAEEYNPYDYGYTTVPGTDQLIANYNSPEEVPEGWENCDAVLYGGAAAAFVYNSDESLYGGRYRNMQFAPPADVQAYIDVYSSSMSYGANFSAVTTDSDTPFDFYVLAPDYRGSYTWVDDEGNPYIVKDPVSPVMNYFENDGTGYFDTENSTVWNNRALNLSIDDVVDIAQTISWMNTATFGVYVEDGIHELDGTMMSQKQLIPQLGALNYHKIGNGWEATAYYDDNSVHFAGLGTVCYACSIQSYVSETEDEFVVLDWDIYNQKTNWGREP